MWEYRGEIRPPFADRPQAGQESVWDYPRPPRLESFSGTVEVFTNDTLMARSAGTLRVLETASPPTIYMPQQDIDMSLLTDAEGSSFCEWKGSASYWKLHLITTLPGFAALHLTHALHYCLHQLIPHHTY